MPTNPLFLILAFLVVLAVIGTVRMTISAHPHLETRVDALEKRLETLEAKTAPRISP